MRRTRFVIWAAAAVLVACGGQSPGTPPDSPGGGSGGPAADGGTTAGSDAGTGGGVDAGGGGGSGSGGGSADAGGGGADAGSGGGSGGGGSGGGSADAGSGGSADAGSGGTGSTFPANQDPAFRVVRESSASSCDGVGPQAAPAAPVRKVKTLVSSNWDCVEGATSDGNGDVAFGCQSYLPERGWNVLYSRDGSVQGEIAVFGRATPLSDGFVAQYTPFGSYEHRLTFTWFDGAAWQTKAWVDPRDDQHLFAAHAWKGVLVSHEKDKTTQWHDEHGNPLRPPLAWPYQPMLAGMDALGNALVLQNTPGTGENELYVGWLRPDDTSFGWMSWRNPSRYGGEPLIGGNLVFGRTTLPGGNAGPAWMKATQGLFMQVVNGGRGYAFSRSTNSCSEPTVTVYAQDGTKCASIFVTGPDDPTCAQPAWIGADGSLLQMIKTAQTDTNGNAQTIWRWWTRYLW